MNEFVNKFENVDIKLVVLSDFDYGFDRVAIPNVEYYHVTEATPELRS